MQGQLGAWIGSLEFKRMQASAELQMLSYYRIMLQKERNNPAVHFSSVPSAALEVVGNELRCAPHDAVLFTLPAAMPFSCIRAESAIPCVGWVRSGMRRRRVLLGSAVWSYVGTRPWRSAERALRCCALSCTW